MEICRKFQHNLSNYESNILFTPLEYAAIRINLISFEICLNELIAWIASSYVLKCFQAMFMQFKCMNGRVSRLFGRLRHPVILDLLFSFCFQMRNFTAPFCPMALDIIFLVDINLCDEQKKVC